MTSVGYTRKHQQVTSVTINGLRRTRSRAPLLVAEKRCPLKMEDLNNLIFSKLDEWRGDLKLVDYTAIFSGRFF